MQQMFVFRHGERLANSKAENVVAIGWHRLGSLDGAWEELKNSLTTAYPDLYEGNSRSVGNAAGSIWRFARDMKVGDLVLVPIEGAFHVAEVNGEPDFKNAWANDAYDMAWCRAAKWELRTFARRDVSNALQMRLKSRQTIVDASDCIADVIALLRGEKPPQFLSAVQEQARKVVIDALQTRANSDQLEEIVAALFRAQGAISSKVQPKNSGKPGDFDVIAQWPSVGAVGGLRVAAQVKHHQGQSGIEGIEQLVTRFRHDQSVDRLVFITTAESVSDSAITMAAQEDITILTRNDLVDWLLSVGLGAMGASS